MANKVKVAFVDKDLKIRTIKRYELSQDGERINIYPKGGKGNENPTFEHTSALAFRKRSLIPPFSVYYEDMYFLRTGGTSCLDFKGVGVTISDIDVDRIKASIGATLLDTIGQSKEQYPSWVIWLILLLSIFSMLIQMGVVKT